MELWLAEEEKRYTTARMIDVKASLGAKAWLSRCGLLLAGFS
jgi:hypothetical protein